LEPDPDVAVGLLGPADAPDVELPDDVPADPEPDDESLDEPAPSEEAAPPDDESLADESPPSRPLLLPPASAAAFAFVAAEDAVERSFLAQPEPLKWMAGALKPLRIVPTAPQLGQVVGPLS